MTTDDSLLAKADELLRQAGEDAPLLEEEAALAGPLFQDLLTDLGDLDDGEMSRLRPPAMQEGTTVGRVRILRLLGRGGMGEVWEGFDELLQRRVAVKALLLRRPLPEGSQERLLREARSLARLDHPGICRVHDLVEEKDQAFLVLELLEGRRLGEYLEDGPTLSERLEKVREVAEAVATAHLQGVIHRDLKPDNIMVQPDGRARVMDFGIARLADRPETESVAPAHPLPTAAGAATATSNLLTHHGSVLGTLRYMSPEQARGETATAASDVYSLGLMLQEAVTGESAYGEVETAAALLEQVCRGHLRSPETISDPVVRRIVEGTTAFDPAARPTAAEVAAALARRLAAPRRRRRFLLAGGGALLVLALLIGVVTSRWVDRRRDVLESEWTEDVRWMEERLRLAYAEPLHDLRPERQVVRDRLAGLEVEVQASGWVGRPPGLAALGRGHLLLGELDLARQRLEAAREAGNRTPRAAFDLGLSLARLFQERLLDLGQARSLTEREADLQVARRELRDPALRYLELGGAVQTESPGSVQALIALVEEREAEALAKAREAFEAVPWDYSAKVLEGRILALRGMRVAARGEAEEAGRTFAAAAEALAVARQSGPSDPTALAAQCELSTSRLRFAPGWQATGNGLEEALAHCRDATTVDPNNDLAWTRLADLQAQVVYRNQGRAAEVGPALEEGLQAAERALEIAPTARAFMSKGNLLAMRASVLKNTGRPGAQASIEEAQAAFERAKELQPTRPLVYANSLMATSIAAEIRRDSGADPAALAEVALRDFERLQKLATGEGSDLLLIGSVNAGNTWTNLGEVRGSRGEDGREETRRGIEILRAGLEINPQSFVHLATLTMASLQMATLEYRQGRSIEDALERSGAFAGRLQEISDSVFYPYFARAAGALLRARAALRLGDDPAPSLERARQEIGRSLEMGDPGGYSWLLLSEIELISALADHQAGRPSRPALDRGLQAIEESRRSNPESALLPAFEGLLRHARGGDAPTVDVLFGEALQRNANLRWWLDFRRSEIDRLLGRAGDSSPSP